MTMPEWRIHHRATTVSTNLDARAGKPGDVFTADFQAAGRGRLDHAWLSPPGENLMMSVVLDACGRDPGEVATLPLVVGYAVLRGLSPFCPGLSPRLKWPNDILVGGRKVCGILCERAGDDVIAGLGVNVRQTKFAPEIANRATSLALIAGPKGVCPPVVEVRDAILRALSAWYDTWRTGGFAAVYEAVRAVDYLRGKRLCVCQTDADASPVRGVSGGIRPDGALDVEGMPVFAGEAHVEEIA